MKDNWMPADAAREAVLEIVKKAETVGGFLTTITVHVKPREGYAAAKATVMLAAYVEAPWTREIRDAREERRRRRLDGRPEASVDR